MTKARVIVSIGEGGIPVVTHKDPGVEVTIIHTQKSEINVNIKTAGEVIQTDRPGVFELIDDAIATAAGNLQVKKNLWDTRFERLHQPVPLLPQRPGK